MAYAEPAGPRVHFGGDFTAADHAAAHAQSATKHKIWELDVFTADLCESLTPAHGHSYGELGSILRGGLEDLLTRDLSDELRSGVIQVIHALQKSDGIFRRRQQYIAYQIPFHMSRVVDEICKQLHGSAIGDVHIFPFECGAPALLVVHQERGGSFHAAVVNTSPAVSKYTPFSAERPPKVLMQTVLELKNVPKARITSEAFWAVNLLSMSSGSDEAVYTHIIPWLNGKTYGEIVNESSPSYATGTKGESNLWKTFIHAMKYILRRAGAKKSDVKMVRALIKQKFLSLARADLEGLEAIPYSTKLILRAAVQNASLSLTRNVTHLRDSDFEEMRRLINEVSEKIEKLPCPDEATTKPPPLLEVNAGWERAQQPDMFPLMECLRRVESVEHFVGAAVDQPRFVPVNFFNVADKVKSFDEALKLLDEVLHLCARITSQLNVVTNAGFLIISLMSQVFLEILPTPLGPKSAATTPCIWQTEIKYGQQLHCLKRVWNCCEIFMWASFSCRTGKEFDAQRIIVVGVMSTIIDAVLRLQATDFPSIISQHLRGYKRKAGYAATLGKLSTQTETSVVIHPHVCLARAAVLDYHAEVHEDIPSTNQLFPWEESYAFCKATQQFLRQVCAVEGFNTQAIMTYFSLDANGGRCHIGRYFEEFRYYRDIYIVLKWMMAPKPRYPNCTGCMECSGHTPIVQVDTYNHKIKVRYQHKEVHCKAGALRFPSFALASKFTAPFEVYTEDDVLHLRNMPSFDDAMGQRDSELLMSFLTAPYVRVPLVLSFFATEDRVSCLTNNTVRQLFEAVLFEPGRFLPHTLQNTVPEHVPAEDANMIASPYGFLFNELQFAPEGVLAPLLRLVKLAREMDAGTVHNASVVELILYLVRTVARVETYVSTIVALVDSGKKVRSIQNIEPSVVATLRDARKTLHDMFSTSFLPMLEAWNGQLVDNMHKWAENASDIDRVTRLSAQLHSHMLVVLRNFTAVELTPDLVSILMSSTLFMTTRHTFNNDSLWVSETEVFDVIQGHRRRIAEWMYGRSASQMSFVLDSVVRIATTTGRRAEGPAFAWGYVAGNDCVGRFTRVDGDAQRRPGVDTKRPELIKSIKSAFGEKSITEELLAIPAVNEGLQDVEINLHIASLTFKAAHLVAVPSEITNTEDVRTIFLAKVKNNIQMLRTMQCAVIQDAENRQWVRLVGQEHDIQFWKNQDPRLPLPSDTMRFYPDDLTPSEDWIFKVVDPVRKAFFVRSFFFQPPIFLLLPEAKVGPDQSVVVISAVCSKTGRKLKEVVAYRDYNCCHVYDIISVGRRFYRTLVYTTDCHFCLRELQPEVADRRHMWQKWERHAAGVFRPDESDEPPFSVNILRHPTHPENVSKSMETFIPSRLLYGLIPSSLLETHRFWQDPDDNLRGYPLDENATHILWANWRDVDYQPIAGDVKQTTFRLFRFAVKKAAPKASEKAVLKSQKISLVEDEADQELDRMRTNSTLMESEPSDGLDNDGSQGLYRQSSTQYNVKTETATVEDYNLMLLNLINAREGTPLHSLASVLARIEVLSHVLVWTTKVDYDNVTGGPITLDLIQLPRLKLTFAGRIDADGKVHIYSMDHAHLFISNLRPNLVVELIQGIPHSLILSDTNQSLAILVPALDVVRPMIVTSPFSTELVINREKKTWYDHLDTRYYLYPIHVSLSFLFTPTLASALYLLALRMLHCEYADAFRLASTIGTDVEFTKEELQNFKLLTPNDVRAEAHACRAKIGLLVAESPVLPLWYLPLTVASMIRATTAISMQCRLTESEERRLLHVCRVLLQKMEIFHDVLKKSRDDLLDTMVARAKDGTPMFEGAERKQIKTLYKEIAAKMRDVCDIRITHAEITRLVIVWTHYRRFQEFSPFQKCIIDNRFAFLEAEAKAIETGVDTEATFSVPPIAKDNLWAFHRDYDALSVKVKEVQGSLKNDDGKPVRMSPTFDFFYCGENCRKAGMCRCKECDENCGPAGGCPCASCDRFNKKELNRLRWIPDIETSSQRMISFYDAFGWVDTMLSQDNTVYEEQLAGTVPPELHQTSDRMRRVTLRMDQNSFLRYYELFTGTSKVRIGSGDSGKDLALLLFPLSHEARRPEAALGHLMHYLANNPSVWPKLPKYNRTSRQSVEERLRTLFQGIMQQAALINRLPGDPPVVPPHKSVVTVKVTPRPTTRRDPLVPILSTRVLPTLSNTDCLRRIWKPLETKLLQVDKDLNVEIDAATRDQLRSQPLKSAVPDGLVAFVTRHEMKLPEVPKTLPFDLRQHKAASTTVARSMIERLEIDMGDFAKGENLSKMPRVVGLAGEKEVRTTLSAGDAAIAPIRNKLLSLQDALTKLRDADNKFVADAFVVAEKTANALPVGKGTRRSEALMELRRLARQEAILNMSYIVSCLVSTQAEQDWQQLNPFLTPATCDAIVSLAIGAVLRANRVGHINRAAESCKELLQLLHKAINPPATLHDEAAIHSYKEAITALVAQKADSLAGVLATKRVYIAEDYGFDPRFLIFEFTWNLVLRSRQKALIEEIYGSIEKNTSIVKQMIMGAGKTTVVGPLLALMLADSKNLVIQVVPPALLDFTRTILRGTFSCVVQKQIFCFNCDRATEVDSEVLSKFLHAKQSRGIVVTTPSSIKSIFLKYIEGIERVEDVSRPTPDGLDRQVEDLGRVLRLWRDAVLIMDEVDMLLHPLKSELNFPIGQKHEIDFAPMRWKLPMHLIDALFYFQTRRVTVNLKESPEATKLLQGISSALRHGIACNALQSTPHITLLNIDFYDSHLKLPFAQWLLLFLKMHHFGGLSDAESLKYITQRPSMQVDRALNEKVMTLEPDHLRTLNLAFEWLNAFLPHTMQKIDRVSFGIMNADDRRRANDEHPNMPRSRFVTAIPFVGKDLPSSSSEFAHPDVVIGLTILAYRYEGLRQTDFQAIMKEIYTTVEKEVGRFNQRRTTLMYNRWVVASGGRLLQSFAYNDQKKVEDEEMGMQPSESLALFGDDDTNSLKSLDVLPLKLMRQANEDETKKLFTLFRRTAEVIHWYLSETIFPEYMRHQHLKLSASGQELGGNILFQRRIGFSGTPSDLLPAELGKCDYEPGTDGKLVHTLTDPVVMSTTLMESGWTVRSLLDFIATASPPFHALIDTGALITGMSNLQVAQYLLKHGLTQMEGVVFLDEFDRKMILVRATGRVLKLAECGIPKVKRFAFYDQVHTTGMDIEHTPNAQAVQTLGKDMTFRDFSQGAYRMRGISVGQTVNVLIIPEVYDLISRTVSGLRPLRAGPGSSPSANRQAEILQDVSAWLLVNSIRSEHTQHNQLCLQSISNVWRKEAYAKLVQSVDAGVLKKRTQTDPFPADTLKALNVFREPVDYAVPRFVPQPRMFSETIETMVNAKLDFITTAEGKGVVGGISAQTKREDEIDNPVIDVQMVQEQEEEREAESEKEKEQEIEMEKFVDLAYSRDEESAMPWAVASLRQFERAQQFFKLNEFHLYKRRPLHFPDGVMLSRNFFNPKWTGHRRIKNVVVSMEWIPSVAALVELASATTDYGAVDVDRARDELGRTIRMMVEHEGKVDAGLMRQFVEIALASVLNGTPMTDKEWDAVKKDLSAEVIRSILESNFLRHEQAGRFTVALSLAEAETIRRVLHGRRLAREPFIPGHDAAVSLRMAPSANAFLDSSNNFPEAITAYHRNRAYHCLRFFDGDLQYSEAELNLVLRSIHMSAEKARQAFFLQVLSCRRRSRQRWERTPVSLMFNLRDPYSLLHQKALGLCMRRELERRQLHLADAFLAMNASHSGQLSPDELWGALRFCRIAELTANDVLDFLEITDTHHEGTLQYPDFLQLLTGSSEIDDDEEVGGRGPQRNLPTIEAYGAEDLRLLRAERERKRRELEAEASRDMETEDRRVREEIEAEIMKEELTLIQTCPNPKLSEANLAFTFTDVPNLPKLSKMFGTILPKIVDEQENKKVSFSLNGDSALIVNTRSLKLITGEPVMNRFMITAEVCFPTPVTLKGNKVQKKGSLEQLADSSTGIVLFTYDVNFWQFEPRKRGSDKHRDEDEPEEEENYDDDDDYNEDDEDDSSGSSSDGDGGDVRVFICKEPSTEKKARISKLRVGDTVQEDVGNRRSHAQGNHSTEWMKIVRPVEGWVPVELRNLELWQRERIVCNLSSNGINIFSTTGSIDTSQLHPTVFAEEKAGGADDDFDAWGWQWDLLMDDYGNDEEGEEEEGDDEIDMGDLTDLVHALKKAKELKIGDKVTRNPEDWHHGNDDGGEGTVGRVVKVEDARVTVSWPSGNKGQYDWGDGGRFELTKVGSAEEGDDIGREVMNDEMHLPHLRARNPPRCCECNSQIRLDSGWYRCNQCDGYDLCKKCFKAMEHEEHPFTDMLALSEILKSSEVVRGSTVKICVKHPSMGWQDAPRDGTPGIVHEIDEAAGTIQVLFNEETWNGLITEVVVVNPKYESYATTWLGSLVNATPQGAKLLAIGFVVDQELIPPKIEAKFKVGDRVKAKWKSGRVYPGEVRAVLPNAQYAVTFDDGDFEPNEPEDDIFPMAFRENSRVRIKRLETYQRALPPTLKAGMVGEVKNLYAHQGEVLRVRCLFKVGTRSVWHQLMDDEVELVVPGKWLADRGSGTLPLPNSSNVIIERAFVDGVVNVEVFIKDRSYNVRLDEMQLRDVKTDEVVGKLTRDPPEQWTEQKPKPKLDDGLWHVVTVGLQGGDVVAIVDGEDFPVTMEIETQTLEEIAEAERRKARKAAGKPLESDEEAEEAEEDAAEETATQEEIVAALTAVAKAGGEDSAEAYAARVNLPGLYDLLIRELVTAASDAPVDQLIATLERIESGDLEVPVLASAAARREASAADAIGEPADAAVVDDGADAEGAEPVDGDAGADDDDECPSDDADDEECEGDEECGDEEAEGEEEEAGEEDEAGEEEEGEAETDDDEEAAGNDDDDDDEGPVNEKKPAVKRRHHGGKDEAIGSEEVTPDGSSDDSDSDDSDDSDSESGSDSSDEEEEEEEEESNVLMRTVEQAMAVDVRLPLAVMPFLQVDVGNLRTKFGVSFPQRRLAALDIAWGDDASADKVRAAHTKIMDETMWACEGCQAKNMRTRKACRLCRRERFDKSEANERKAKVLAVTTRSREATELRRKLHAKLRSQYQRQLEELEDVTKLSSLL